VAAVVLASRDAAAEIPLADAKGWTLTLDGRFNTFVSFSKGDQQPPGIPAWSGGVEDRDAGTGSIQTTRIRSGFVENVFGFTLVKQLSATLKLTGRFALWVGTAQERSKTDNPSVDVRDVYTLLEGPWGGLLAGRTLSLFGRGGILVDHEIQHGFGLGHPCAVRSAVGGACGYAGHGLLYPSFNAGIVYNTPSLGGLQLSVGAYDPAVITERTYEITPYPRIEGELIFNLPKRFRIFADFLWQRLANNTPFLDAAGNNIGEQVADASGFSAGAALNVGPLAMGGSFYTGKGLGIYIPMANTPLFSDEKGILRVTSGLVGMASLTFGEAKLAGGAGISQLKMTPTEKEPFSTLDIPKQQIGISFGYYQGIYKTITFALEYFQGRYQWYDLAPDATMPMVIQHPKQTVNFVNAGITMLF